MVKPVPAPIRAERKHNVTISYGQIADKELHEAMEKLDKFTGWQDPSDIMRFNKLKSVYDREKRRAGSWYMKLVDRHAVMEVQKKKNPTTGEFEPVKDRQGKVVKKPKWAPQPGGRMDIVMRDAERFDKEAAIFHGYKFTVKVHRFLFEDLAGAGLTPAEIRACQCMIDNIPDDLLTDDDQETLLDDVPDELKGIVDIEPEEDDADADGRVGEPTAERAGGSCGADPSPPLNGSPTEGDPQLEDPDGRVCEG